MFLNSSYAVCPCLHPSVYCFSCTGALTICLAKPLSWYLYFWVDLPAFLSSFARQSCSPWPPTSSFNKLKSVLLNLQVCALLLAFFTPLRILNCANCWLLQPKLPVIVTSPTSSLLFWEQLCATVVGPSIVYIKKLSLISSKNYLGYLCPAVLPFQWMSGRLESVLRTRVYGSETSLSFRKDFIQFPMPVRWFCDTVPPQCHCYWSLWSWPASCLRLLCTHWVCEAEIKCYW